MIYPANFEQRVGFDRIREQVMSLCSMQSSREVIASEGLSTSKREIEERLMLADQMRLLISMESGADIGEQEDIAGDECRSQSGFPPIRAARPRARCRRA